MKRIPRVILLIPTSRSYERGILRGIAQYAKLKGPWVTYHPPHFYLEPKRRKDLFNQMMAFDADGIIMREWCRPEGNDTIVKMGLPMIVCPYTDNPRFAHLPLLRGDSDQVGQTGAQYLISHGYRVFGFCGYSTMPWSKRRANAFRERVSDEGCKTYVYSPAPDKTWDTSEDETSLLVDWLHGLPKPIGIMACNDDRARQLCEACKVAGYNIPDEIGIMGVDNDEMVCSLNTPALTSIALNTETCGYRAAQLLDEWIRTKEKPAQGINVLPTRVVERQSTDVLHIQDADVAQAIRFIRDHSARPIQVAAVVGAVGMSLRTLQQRFQKVLGHTIHDEINRARMERVAQMLVQTNLPIKQIASDLGYPSPKHIARAFRKEKGMTLLEFRVKFGG